MSLFLLVAENIRNPGSEDNLVLLAKILLSNILEKNVVRNSDNLYRKLNVVP